MKKILIVGAFGYIGARLSLFLAKKGFSVTAFGRTPPPKDHFWYNIIEDTIIGDVRDESILNQICSRNYNVVINLISLDNKNSEVSPIDATLTNVIPTWNLLDRLVSKNFDLFIYFSTRHVLGTLNVGKIDESYNPNPNSKYGLTHLMSEKVIDYYHNKYKVRCINLRVSNGYGSPVFKVNNCWSLVVNDFCKSVFEKKKITLLSDGSSKCDFIHISDICTAVEILIEKNNHLSENLFNLCSNELITITELAKLVQKIYFEKYGEEIPIVYQNRLSEKKNSLEKNIYKNVFDNKKLKNLGFEPSTSLKDGIYELFEFLESY